MSHFAARKRRSDAFRAASAPHCRLSVAALSLPLFVAGCALLFCGCARGAATASQKPKLPPEAAKSNDYTLTKKSTSDVERGQHLPPVDAPQLSSPTTAALAVSSAHDDSDSCRAEFCEGNLSKDAVAELRKTAEKAQDCYEHELKERDQVEGRLTVYLRLLGPRASERSPCSVRLESKGIGLSEPFQQCLIGLFSNVSIVAANGCVDVAVPLVFVRKEVQVEESGAPAERP